GIESTIVGFHGNVTTLLRQGGVSTEEIRRIVGDVDIHQISSSNPMAPGMLLSHYAPRTNLIRGDIETLAQKNSSRNFGVLDYTSTSGYPGIALSKKGDLK